MCLKEFRPVNNDCALQQVGQMIMDQGDKNCRQNEAAASGMTMDQDNLFYCTLHGITKHRVYLQIHSDSIWTLEEKYMLCLFALCK